MIPFNNLKIENAKEKELLKKAMGRVVSSGWYILGTEVKNFENKFANYIGVKYGIGVANGLEALQISLMALGIGKGDEVITTPLSAVATTLAIKAVGAKPVFVDTDNFHHIDANKIESKITKRTKAILPVHLYGQSVQIDKISSIARKYKIHIIEDCAQSHGTMYKNKKNGSIGALGCFSFYPTKNLGALGDAGMITTNNKALAEKCMEIRNYGQKNRYEHSRHGLNSRLDELQAAILNERLKYLDRNNEKRNLIAKIYRENLTDIEGIKLPELRKNSSHCYHLFVIETNKRDALQNFLKKKGVGTLIHYPLAIHQQEAFPEHNRLSFPVVQSKISKILSLPIYPNLKEKDALLVCKIIRQFYA